jgi:hypothetical protein
MKIIDLPIRTKVNVFTDNVAGFKADYPDLDVTPVDVYGNFAPLDKNDPDNLKKMEESIRMNNFLEDETLENLTSKTALDAEVEGGEF